MKITFNTKAYWSLALAAFYMQVAQATDSVTFTVPISVDNLQAEIGQTPQLMVSCGIGTSTTPSVQKGLTKQLVPLVIAGGYGSYHGQMQISVAPSNPSLPFAKGDFYICNLNAGSGWANAFSNYLSVNKPIDGQPIHMWYGGALQ